MKYLIKILFIDLLLWYCNQSYCQSTDMPSNNMFFQVVEAMPEFPGGEEGMIRFIRNNLIYPDSARDHHIEGRVVVGFVINENGKISDVAIKKSVSLDIDAEAIRVVNLMPLFKPGRQQGKPVKVNYVLPIRFKLEDDSSIANKPHTLKKLNRKKKN